MPSAPVGDEDGGDGPDLFELLSDGTRRRIIDVLYQSSESSLRFSELTRRVDVHDTGRFNYHLRRLRGTLVRKTEDGYRLTDRGIVVAEAVLDELDA